MTAKQVSISICEKHLPYDFDFWFSSISGTLFFGGNFLGLGMIIFNKMTSENGDWIFWGLLILGFFASMCWNDQQLNRVESNQTKEQNFKVVLKCLQILGWKHSKAYGAIYVSSGLKLPFVHAIIIPTNGEILYKFKYKDVRGMLLPFFIGIRTYCKTNFERNLNAQL